MRILDQLNENERKDFELPYASDLLPDVGSRALENSTFIIIEDGEHKKITILPQWQVVQEGRYRYCTSNEGNKVKIVIAEYLAVEVELVN